MYFLIFGISFFASIIGSICGIGGGIIMKPAMDALTSLELYMINFLSGCTVLSMSLYSVTKNKLTNDSKINMSVGTPLAIGASIGGLVGKELFQIISMLFESINLLGALQAFMLVLLTLGTLIYSLNKGKIKTLSIENKFICLLIGLVLGCISSFLGIGGGPFNLIVLYYFFTMSTKEAAQNSLYIILFSQLTSLIKSLLTIDLFSINLLLLIGMTVCGIIGGFVGRKINKKIDDKVVDKLFLYLMILIIFINIFNIYKYLSM